MIVFVSEYTLAEAPVHEVSTQLLHPRGGWALEIQLGHVQDFSRGGSQQLRELSLKPDTHGLYIAGQLQGSLTHPCRVL